MASEAFGSLTIEISGEVDRSYTYPRPDWPQVIAAWHQLERRDRHDGGLPDDLTEPVRALLAAVSRLSLNGIERAFPRSPEPPAAPTPLRLVVQDQEGHRGEADRDADAVDYACPACGSRS